MRHLEETFGRPRFDKFLRNYFNAFAFMSITTEEFVAYMREQLLDPVPELTAKASVEEWNNRPGLPHAAPRPSSNFFGAVEEGAESWLRGEVAATDISFAHWDTQERQHFLRHVHERVDLRMIEELDRAFRLTDSNNSEILHTWLVTAIRHGYEPAYERLEEYLTSVGRMKYLRPLYRELIKTPEGKNRALEIFKKARTTYHSIAATAVENIIGESTRP